MCTQKIRIQLFLLPGIDIGQIKWAAMTLGVAYKVRNG